MRVKFAFLLATDGSAVFAGQLSSVLSGQCGEDDERKMALQLADDRLAQIT